MPLIAKAGGSGEDFTPVPSGIHLAVCVSVYDLGTHYSKEFDKDSHKVLIAWEIPGETVEIDRDGEMVTVPRMISNRYTLSLHEKSGLCKHLEGWRGKSFTDKEKEGFELRNLLGKGCTLNVIHKDGKDKHGKPKTYANITSISPVMKGMSVPAPINKPVFYCIEDHGKNIPADCPEWISKIIKESQEWAKIDDLSIPEKDIPVEVGDVPADNIPF